MSSRKTLLSLIALLPLCSLSSHAQGLPPDTNRPPVCGADFIDTQGVPIIESLLQNDFDPDGDTIHFGGVSVGPKFGNVMWSPEGGILFMKGYFLGYDEFQYTAADGQTFTSGTVFVRSSKSITQGWRGAYKGLRNAETPYFVKFGSPNMTDDGEKILYARYFDGARVVDSINRGYNYPGLVLKGGDPAPEVPNSELIHIAPPVVAPSGKIAFVASARVSGSADLLHGLWSDVLTTTGSFQLIKGDASQNSSRVVEKIVDYAISDSAVAYVTETPTPSQLHLPPTRALWIHTSVPTLCLSSGSMMYLERSADYQVWKVVKDFSVFSTSRPAFSNAHDLVGDQAAVLVTFHDGNQAVFAASPKGLEMIAQSYAFAPRTTGPDGLFESFDSVTQDESGAIGFRATVFYPRTKERAFAIFVETQTGLKAVACTLPFKDAGKHELDVQGPVMGRPGEFAFIHRSQSPLPKHKDCFELLYSRDGAMYQWIDDHTPIEALKGRSLNIRRAYIDLPGGTSPIVVVGTTSGERRAIVTFEGSNMESRLVHLDNTEPTIGVPLGRVHLNDWILRGAGASRPFNNHRQCAYRVTSSIYGKSGVVETYVADGLPLHK